MYTVSYEIKLKDKNRWEKVSQSSNYFAKLGNCLTWLNSRFDSYYEELYNKEAFFLWSIKGSKHSQETYQEYEGLFEITNESFIEKVISLDLIKKQMEDYKK